MTTTAPLAKIDARLKGLDPDSLRARTLLALRQFRASWVELGGLLNQMALGGDYKDAGFDDFEVYCARELGLKKPTVQKLMVSYNYMKKYESKRLASIEDVDDDVTCNILVPDYQTIELLDRVRRRDRLPEEEMDGLHRKAFDGEVEERTLRRDLQSKLKPKPQVDPDKAEKAAILGASRKLRREVAKSHFVPEGLRDRLEGPLVELEALDYHMT